MPTSAEFLANGLRLHQAGNFRKAEKIYRQILKADPKHLEALHLLGVLSGQQGKHAQAIQYFRQAIAIAPAHGELHNNLGTAYSGAGKTEQAEACFDRALQLQPDNATAHNNLGALLHQKGDFENAKAHFREAMNLRPPYVDARLNLIKVLRQEGKWDEVLPISLELAEMQPASAQARFELGVALQELGRLPEAAAAFQEVLRLNPGHADAHTCLGRVLQQQGQLDIALGHFQEALRANPHSVLTYFYLSEYAKAGTYQFTDPEIARIRALLASDKVALKDASLLHFTLASALDQRKSYSDAFAAFRQGNDLKRKLFEQRGMKLFDPAEHRRWIDDLIAVFDKPFFKRVQSFGLGTERPMFIVGMPRSGTTLVEQILASHPQVFGAGELPDMAELASALPGRLPGNGPFPQCMAAVDAELVRSLAEAHEKRLAERAGGAARVIDKLPGNFENLGLIATLFPKARIIHCRRDPLDTCVSCYLQDFRTLTFTFSLEDLGFYYRQYERLMAHWREVLPLPIYEVQYEDLVADQEAVSRQLVAFCGLEWDERCLAFHETRRVVQTASELQVRQPVYQRSIGRWRRYEAHLQPLIDALAGSGET